MAPVQQLEEVSWSVVCAACCHMVLVLLSIPFLYLKIKKKSGIDKSTVGSTIPACLSLKCFFNRSTTERTHSSKILSLMFVYVCFVMSGLILWILENLWFNDLCAD